MTGTSAEFYRDLLPADVETAIERLNYRGSGEAIPKMFGPEIEFFIAKIDEDDLNPDTYLNPITYEESQRLSDTYAAYTEENLGKRKVPEQEIISSHFELNFGPVTLENFAEEADSRKSFVQAFFTVARDLGFSVLPVSHAPHINGITDVDDQVVPNDRMRNFMSQMRGYMGDDVVKFGTMCAGIHVSNCYTDTDDMFDNARRTYYLAPFIYALSNNSFPFWNGLKDSQRANARYQVIQEFSRASGGRSGTDPLFMTAKNGDDYLRAYLQRQMNLPLMGYYPAELSNDEKAQGLSEPTQHSTRELGASPQTPVSFKDLEALGHNNISSFYYAGSAMWYSGKLPLIPARNPENGYPYNRWENRVWNTGTWQLDTAILMEALMNGDEECGRDIDALLAKYGFHPEGPAHDDKTATYMIEALQSAEERSGRYGLDFTFGTGTAQEFGEEFIAIMNYHAEKYGLMPYLRAANDIIINRRTDAQVLAEICETPEDVAEFVKNCDPDALFEGNKSFAMLQDEGLLPRGRKPAPAGPAAQERQPKL